MLLLCYITSFVPEPSISFFISYDYMTLTIIGITYDVILYSFISKIMKIKTKLNRKWKVKIKRKES